MACNWGWLVVTYTANRQMSKDSMQDTPKEPVSSPKKPAIPATSEPQKEVGGQKGPEPTRYGDWESNGRCTDF